MTGTTGLEVTPFRTGDLDCGETSGLENLMGRLFDGVSNVSKMEILIFFVTESPAGGDLERTCSGEACLDDASLDRRTIGGGVVVGRRCKGLSLLGLAEEILMSWIWWSLLMCSLIFEVFSASKEHLGI
jgi:hypothetical protein